MKIIKKLLIYSFTIISYIFVSWCTLFKHTSKYISTSDKNGSTTTWNDLNTIEKDTTTTIEEKATNISEKYIKENNSNIINDKEKEEETKEKGNTDTEKIDFSEKINILENNEVNSKIFQVWYENKIYNFKITIPSNRTFQENNQWFNIILKAPKDDEINENIGIKIQELQTQETLKSFTDRTTKWLKNLYKNYNEIKKENIIINSIEGIELTYEISDNWHELKAKQTVLLNSNKAYIIQYTSTKKTFDNYINDVNSIINSFTILN